MSTSHATADGMPKRKVRVAYVMLAACVLGVTGLLTYAYRSLHADYVERGRVSELVYAALADPEFVERARVAGYRLSPIWPRDTYSGAAMVRARCARSNETGPLPCDMFPYDPTRPEVVVMVDR